MKLNEMNYTEMKEFAEQLNAWLGVYTNECIERVMDKIDQIVENETAMYMIKKLAEGERYQQDERNRRFTTMLDYIKEGKEIPDCFRHIHGYDIHNTESYRNVLYDMYVRGE